MSEEPHSRSPSPDTDQILTIRPHISPEQLFSSPLQPPKKVVDSIPRERLRSRTYQKSAERTRKETSDTENNTKNHSAEQMFEKYYAANVTLKDIAGKIVSTKISISLWLLLLVTYMCAFAPTQPVSQENAQAIVHGCTYDGYAGILCTHEGCFRYPTITNTGSLVKGAYEQTYEYIVITHSTWWFYREHTTLKTPTAIKCVTELLGGKHHKKKEWSSRSPP